MAGWQDAPLVSSGGPAWASAPLVDKAAPDIQAPPDIQASEPAAPPPSTATPQLPAQYRAYQSLMKSPAEIQAMGHSRDAVMALPFAAIPGGPLMQGVTGAISGGISGANDTPAGGDWIANAMKGAGVGGVLGLGIGAAAPAAVKGYQAVANRVAPSAAFATDQATALLQRALQRDKISPENVDQTLARYPDKNVAVMDAGGSNTARLARTVRTLPGEGSEQIDKFLAERQADQHARVLNDIRQSLADGSDAHGITQGLIEQRSKAAKPLYEQAGIPSDPKTFAQAPIIDTPAVKSIIEKSADVRQAIAQAKRLPDYADLPDNSIVLLDKAYKYVGDEANAAKIGGKGTASRDLNSLRMQLKDAITNGDPAHPYQQALDAYSGPSQSKDAIEMGGDFLKSRPEEIKTHLSDLGQSDQDFYRVGAARALQDRVLKAGDSADAVSRVFGNKNLRSQIETVFGQGSAEKFAESMTAEKNATATNRFVRGGSQTADKAADIADQGSLAQDAAEGFMRGGVRGAVTHPLLMRGRAQIDALFNGMSPQVRNELSRLLVETRPGTLNGLAGGNVPATTVDNWASTAFPFIGSQALKNLLLVPPGSNRP